MKQSASPAHFRSSVVCYIPHYSPTNTHFLIPAPTLFSVPLRTLPHKTSPSSKSNTHTRADPQNGCVCRASRPNPEPASHHASSFLVFHFWFCGSFQIWLLDSFQKPTAKFFLVLKDYTYFPLTQHPNLLPSSFSQWIQSWCCCRENLLADLLPRRTAGEVLC